jgi:MoaA/NifB/PqqE/SkfB family radical SAM enzyme
MRLVLVDRLLRKSGGVATAASVQPKPKRVFWWWEQICNLSCNHCDIGNRTESYRLDPALSAAQKRQVLERLGSWLGPGYSLSLIAGEPFLHRDVFEALSAARDHGAVTSLTTNGTLIASRARAKQVVDTGLAFMAVSIDSMAPEFHDTTRGKPGTWAQAMKAVSYLREEREKQNAKAPIVWINSIVMKQNLDELLKLSDWCRDQGIEGHTFQPIATTDFFQGTSQQGDYWFRDSSLWPEPEQALAFVDEVEKRKADGYPIQNSTNDFAKWRQYFRDPVGFGRANDCGSELETMLVTHEGDVKMCPNTREAFGNILKDDLDVMWRSPAAGRARSHVFECDSQCKILANTKEDFYF